MRLNFNKHFKIKISDRNFTPHFDAIITSLSSDKKITVQQCNICGERCFTQMESDCVFRLGFFFLINSIS